MSTGGQATGIIKSYKKFIHMIPPQHIYPLQSNAQTEKMHAVVYDQHRNKKLRWDHIPSAVISNMET